MINLNTLGMLATKPTQLFKDGPEISIVHTVAAQPLTQLTLKSYNFITLQINDHRPLGVRLVEK